MVNKNMCDKLIVTPVTQLPVQVSLDVDFDDLALRLLFGELVKHDGFESSVEVTSDGEDVDADIDEISYDGSGEITLSTAVYDPDKALHEGDGIKYEPCLIQECLINAAFIYAHEIDHDWSQHDGARCSVTFKVKGHEIVVSAALQYVDVDGFVGVVNRTYRFL